MVVWRRLPLWILDRCCDDEQFLLDAGWVEPDINGDNHHFQKRIVSTVSVPQTHSKLSIQGFKAGVADAFASLQGQQGIFPPPATILTKLQALKEKYSDTLWNKNTDVALKNQTVHINNCTTLPAGIQPLVYDRHGKAILARGTGGTNEGLHRCVCSAAFGHHFIYFFI